MRCKDTIKTLNFTHFSIKHAFSFFLLNYICPRKLHFALCFTKKEKKMKKFFTLALAFVAMSFAACGVKTGNTAELDSLALQMPTDEMGAVEQADAVVTLLEEQLHISFWHLFPGPGKNRKVYS